MGYSNWKPAFRQGIIDRMLEGESAKKIAEELDLKKADIQNLFNNFKKNNFQSQVSDKLLTESGYEYLGYTIKHIPDGDIEKWKNSYVNRDIYYIDHPEVFKPEIIAHFELSHNIELMRNPHKSNPVYQERINRNAIIWDQEKIIYLFNRPYNPTQIDNLILPNYSISLNEFGIVENYIKYKETAL